MTSYLEKPGAHLFGTHPGGLHTIGTVQAGREHCATFFNCSPEEESILSTFPIVVLYIMGFSCKIYKRKNSRRSFLHFIFLYYIFVHCSNNDAILSKQF